MVGERPFLEIGQIDSCRVSQAGASRRQRLSLFRMRTCERDLTIGLRADGSRPRHVMPEPTAMTIEMTSCNRQRTKDIKAQR